MIQKSKEHLEDVKETYFEHMIQSFKISLCLVVVAAKSAIHAIIPSLFTRNVGPSLACIMRVAERVPVDDDELDLPYGAD